MLCSLNPSTILLLPALLLSSCAETTTQEIVTAQEIADSKYSKFLTNVAAPLPPNFNGVRCGSSVISGGMSKNKEMESLLFSNSSLEKEYEYYDRDLDKEAFLKIPVDILLYGYDLSTGENSFQEAVVGVDGNDNVRSLVKNLFNMFGAANSVEDDIILGDDGDEHTTSYIGWKAEDASLMLSITDKRRSVLIYTCL